MPYSSSSELPKSIKDALPKGAQSIFVSAFNSAVDSGKSEESAFKIAWSAVKSKYRKIGESWTKKTISVPAYSQGAPLLSENLAGGKKKKPKKKKPKKKS